MDSVIQFGHDAFGIVFAYLVAAVVLAVVLGTFVGVMDALQRWVDKNGWNE